VSRIFITGSTDGLGRAAAGALMGEGHDVVLPYLLTALIGRPDRLIYLSSGLHHAGAGSLRDTDWASRPWNAARAYAESKLYLTALALGLARAWPDVLSNAVDPGWVPTKMGGPAATGDLQAGYLTQTWLAVSHDAAATVTGGYWYHRQRQPPAAHARDPAFQDQLMDRLAALTGVALS
jgi:NAD(P)-dependent dehydrogenase (short-subunit alcohol dehydrogenase family)